MSQTTAEKIAELRRRREQAKAADPAAIKRQHDRGNMMDLTDQFHTLGGRKQILADREFAILLWQTRQ